MHFLYIGKSWNCASRQTCCVLCMFTCKRVSRHNDARLFNISTSKSVPHVPTLFNSLTWKCALRHNVVQFFTSDATRSLRTRRFSEPTSRPPEPRIIGRTLCFATFLPFAHLHLLSSDPVSSLIFFLPLFSSLMLPISAFSSVNP